MSIHLCSMAGQLWQKLYGSKAKIIHYLSLDRGEKKKSFLAPKLAETASAKLSLQSIQFDFNVCGVCVLAGGGAG